MNSEKVKELNALISDIDCLEPLYKWTNEVNIFNILKLNRIEIRHSNMLSWLISPNETHGLGDKFLKKLLIYATNGTNMIIMRGLTPIDIDLMELSNVVIYREKDNIDVLLISEQNKLILAIENKIGTGEHSNQLNRYRELLQSKYGNGYRFVLVYLTPEGLEPSDPENWISMSYSFLLEELNKLLDIYEISDKAKIYIEDYIKAIRRNVVEDKALKELCKKIYYKHKEACDLIFDNKPDIQSEISEFVYSYLKENEARFNITVWDDYTSHYIRFTPNQLVELYGDMGSEEWVHSKNLLGFEIQNFQDYDLSIKVIIGPSKSECESYRQLLLNAALSNNWKMRGKGLSDKWKTIKTDTLVSKEKLKNLNLDNMDFMDDIIGVPLDNYFDKEINGIIEVLVNAANDNT